MKGQSFFKRLGWAMKGVLATFRTEASFRTQLVFGLAAFILLLLLRPHAYWWALVAVTTGGVLATELINTALEAVVDHLHPSEHPMIGRAKDCASGAVLIMSLASLGVVGALLWDTYWH
jgi:undecaprenol kinase